MAGREVAPKGSGPPLGLVGLVGLGIIGNPNAFVDLRVDWQDAAKSEMRHDEVSAQIETGQKSRFSGTATGPR